MFIPSIVHRICVFAGSRDGGPAYVAAVRALSIALVRRGHGLVYGGGRAGLMGVLADAAIAAGGDVRGVIPRDLVDRELAHTGLTDLSVAASMHDRKATMYELSAAFIAIPGGFGTLDEMFETLTWRQLGIHSKPLGLLEVDGYWQPILAWLERAVRDGFVGEDSARDLLVDSDPERLLDRLLADNK
jgi:hypothetical protein